MELVTHPLSLIELEDRKKIRKSTSTTSGDGRRNKNASDNELVVFPPLQTQNAASDGKPLATISSGTVAAPPSRTRTTLVIVILTGVTFLNSMGSGILTVALPRISTDLALNESLLFWPSSVYALAAGCTLLLFGSLADVVGGKRIWLAGSIMYTFLTLGCGSARTAIQLILFRALLGLAISMCLPAAVSLMTRTCPPGRRRNIGFASMGMGQPLGYAVGLVLGGVFVDTVGWRFGYYISAILSGFLSIAAIWGLPATVGASHPDSRITFTPWYKKLVQLDWLGMVLISTSLALLSYVLAYVH
jgi:MFS family permease